VGAPAAKNAQRAMVIDRAFHVSAPTAAVWALLTDIPRLLPHVPGAQMLQTAGAGAHTAAVTLHAGKLQGTYTISIAVESVDEANHTAAVRISADDVAGHGGMSAVVTASVIPEGLGSRIAVHADIEQSGASAALEQHLAGSATPAAANDFVANIQRAIQSRAT